MALDAFPRLGYRCGKLCSHVRVEVWPLAEHHNDLTIDLSSYGFPGKAEFHDGAVRVIDVDCPDKVCESMGYVKNEMEAVVCLPNRMSIIIYTPEEYHNLVGD